MNEESFSRWRIPPEVDGVVLFEERTNGRRFRAQDRHRHAELELQVVARGRAAFVVGEVRLEATAGTLLWVPPRSDHVLLESTDDLTRWMLLVRKRTVRRVLPGSVTRRLLGRRQAPLCRTVGKAATRALLGLYADARKSRNTATSMFNTAIAYALARSWMAYDEAARSPDSAPLHEAVAQAIRLLRDDVPPPSLVELSRRVGVSEAHLSKLFTQNVGVSITDLRNRLRLERFLELYGDGRGPTMTAAALEAGFGSYPQFHRVFRRQMGLSPAEYRRRN